MKLVVNMAMGTMMTTLAESLTLADKSGLSQEQLLEVLGLGVMANPMFKMKVCPCSVQHSLPSVNAQPFSLHSKANACYSGSSRSKSSNSNRSSNGNSNRSSNGSSNRSSNRSSSV